jgi:hypothetical protein
MVAPDLNHHIAATAHQGMSQGNPVGERLRHYFDRHPEVFRQEFLLDAVRRELLIREQTETRNSSPRSSISAADIAVHAWLSQRLAMLHAERDGIWGRLRRFFFGNRSVR